MTVITKGGSAKFHGTAFDFFAQLGAGRELRGTIFQRNQEIEDLRRLRGTAARSAQLRRLALDHFQPVLYQANPNGDGFARDLPGESHPGRQDGSGSSQNRGLYPVTTGP